MLHAAISIGCVARDLRLWPIIAAEEPEWRAEKLGHQENPKEEDEVSIDKNPDRSFGALSFEQRSSSVNVKAKTCTSQLAGADR